jgi:mono/diheme cytochrome c family protein
VGIEDVKSRPVGRLQAALGWPLQFLARGARIERACLKRSYQPLSRLGTIMSFRLLISLAAALAVLVAADAAVLRGKETEPLTFEQHIRPIFKAHCFHCHGEEAEHEGSLDLRQVRLMAKGGDSGEAIVAGKPGESLLLQRIEAGEMPPPEKGKPLPAKEVARIRRWLAEGAKTAHPETETLAPVTDDERAFWSFQPLAEVPLPIV